MADEFDEFADDVKRYEQAQEELAKTLEELDGRSGQPFDAEHAALLLDALKSTSELRDFLIRDLGTTVANLQNLENGLTSLGDFVNSKVQSLNDLTATVAALVDVLLTKGAVSPQELTDAKNAIIASATAPAPGPDGPTN
jgi:hypothetical protein